MGISDFRDLLASFNKHCVEYVIVGGYALAVRRIATHPGGCRQLSGTRTATTSPCAHSSESE